MAFELWDTETGNLVGNYDTREEALKIVQAALQMHGAGVVMPLALGFEDRRGHTTSIAQGRALIELARNAPPTPERDEALAKRA